MKISVENSEALQKAIHHIQENSKQTIAKTLKYAASSVLRTLSSTARIRVAKKIPPMKCLKKVKGSTVLEKVRFRNARTIYPNMNYYIFISDTGKIKQNFAPAIYPNQTMTKKDMLMKCQRIRAGLARDTMRRGLRLLGSSGGSYQEFASRFVNVRFSGNFNSKPAEGDNDFMITVEDNLFYINDAFKSSNALDEAIGIAAQQMIQRFDHSQSEHAQKFNAQFNNN